MKKKKLVSVFLSLATALCALGALPGFFGCAAGEIVYTLSGEGDHYMVSASKSNITDEVFESICPYYSEEAGPLAEPTEGALPVTAIAARGFMGCTRLEYVAVPDFISSIGYSAFAYCLGLSSFKFPDNEDFKSIPSGIFGGDNSLREVEIPKSVERIEGYAFYGSCLRSVTVPASVTFMGNGVFYRSDYLTNVELYAQIEAVPYATFYSCDNLKSVTLSNSVKEIKGYEYLNGDGEVISEDQIIHYEYGEENDTEDPNYEDNVTETVPAFYYDYLDAGSETITFDYELEELYYLGTEEELRELRVGDYNICLTESSRLTVYCLMGGEWVSFSNWKF